VRQSSPYEPVFNNELGLQFYYGIEFSRGTYRFTHQAQRVLLGVTAESRTKAQRVLVVTGCIGKKTHVPHRIDTTLDKSLYRWDNTHLPLGLQFHYGITYRFTHQAQRVLLGVTAESRTKAQRVLVVAGVYWEKTHVPHRLWYHNEVGGITYP